VPIPSQPLDFATANLAYSLLILKRQMVTWFISARKLSANCWFRFFSIRYVMWQEYFFQILEIEPDADNRSDICPSLVTMVLSIIVWCIVCYVQHWTDMFFSCLHILLLFWLRLYSRLVTYWWQMWFITSNTLSTRASYTLAVMLFQLLCPLFLCFRDRYQFCSYILAGM